jgi:hypothetical protein
VIDAACLNAEANVCLWHKADVPLVLTNVRFEGKNGHEAGVTPFPLMTQADIRNLTPRFPARAQADLRG